MIVVDMSLPNEEMASLAQRGAGLKVRGRQSDSGQHVLGNGATLQTPAAPLALEVEDEVGVAVRLEAEDAANHFVVEGGAAASLDAQVGLLAHKAIDQVASTALVILLARVVADAACGDRFGAKRDGNEQDREGHSHARSGHDYSDRESEEVVAETP